MGVMDRVRAWRESRADAGQGTGETQARPAVLNADRASNAETPRSAAVATQLGWAEIRRGQAAKSPEFSGDYKAAARGHIESARDANAPGGIARVRERAAAERGEAPGRAARAFVGAEIARAGNRQAQPKQGEGQRDGDGDGRVKRSRVSQGVG